VLFERVSLPQKKCFEVRWDMRHTWYLYCVDFNAHLTLVGCELKDMRTVSNIASSKAQLNATQVASVALAAFNGRPHALASGRSVTRRPTFHSTGRAGARQLAQR
jgi:hypothetical protein